MKTVVRVGLGIAVFLVVLAIAAIVIVKTIDPNTLIAPIQDKVKAATGRDLAVRGGAHIEISFHPRIVLDDVVLGNAPWGRAKYLATVERLELSAALLPILWRRFELEEIALQKPVVALETDGKGRKNWQPDPSPSASPGTPGGGSLGGAITFGDIMMTDGLFTFQDGPNGDVSRVAIEKLVVAPRALRGDVAVDFRGAFGDTPLEVAGTVGSVETLIERRAPYPIDVKGTVAGQAFEVATRVRAESARYAFDDLKLALGANAFTGSLAVDNGGARPKVIFDLKAPALAMSALPVPAVPAGKQAAPAKAPARAWMIPDTAVSFAPLHVADADGKLAIGKLTLANGRSYNDVQLALTNADGRLDVSRFSAGAFGGTVQGSLAVDASGRNAPSLKLNLEGSGLALGALLAATGQQRDVRGGPTTLALDLAMRGTSPRAWASTASGNVRIVVGRATLQNAKLDAALDSLASAINPFRARDPSTELVCAVVRFPIANGIARVDRSIAMETDKLGVSASGTLDFRDETLDLQINPKVRKGISLDIAGLADLVRVTGPFSSPRVAIDPIGSAKVIASVGAAIGTVGLSAVAQGLLAWADGSGPGPCQVALEGPSTRDAPAPATNPQPQNPLANEVGKALGKLFGR
ncbi:MAG: AsmA family protein [Burkholderiales bacterium]